MNSDSQLSIELEPDQLFLKANDLSDGLYQVISGTFLIFLSKGPKIIPIGEVGPGEFLGDVSYIDRKKRSAYVLSLTKCVLRPIPTSGLDDLPNWPVVVARHMAKRLRLVNDILHHSNLRAHKDSSIPTLSIEEERKIFKILKSAPIKD